MTRSYLLVAFALLLCSVQTTHATGPTPGQIKNLVTFGDSYTDVGDPGDNSTSWPTFAAQDGNFTLYPFAKSGGACSNNLTYRAYPSVMESQLPTYFAEVADGTLKLDPESTVYTLWIGTNDVGINALLTGSQTPGVTLVNTTDCAVSWVKVMYDSGARNFVFQNMLPLEKTVLYSVDSYPNWYWTEPRNSTEWNLFMTELTNAGNELSSLKLQALVPTLPGAHVGYFDSYGLIMDIIGHPANYLTGSAYNVTGCVRSCVLQINDSTSAQGACDITEGAARDSYLWYDEVHPSEQTDRVIGREIAAAVNATSRWITWLS
ncbi:GDSL lipase/acylhydrolase [Amylocystis lapponica]|nr:GDSL lipase/acylhydrolase [Amylocystis lapponica]